MMKNTLIALSATATLTVTASAATIVWEENFDALATGGLANDGADNVDNQDVFFRAGGASSIRIEDGGGGDNHLYLGFRYNATNANIVLSDTWDETLDYTLTFDIDGSSDQLNGTLPSVSLGYGAGTSRLATAVFDSDTFTVGTTSVTLSVSAADIATAGANGENIYIRIDKPGSTAGNRAGQYDLDNFVLESSAVPEPSSTALLGLGGLAFILRRRR